MVAKYSVSTGKKQKDLRDGFEGLVTSETIVLIPGSFNERIQGQLDSLKFETATPVENLKPDDFEGITFEEVFALHLYYNQYAGYNGVFVPSEKSKELWQICGAAMPQKTKLARRLQSAYYFTQKIAKKVLDKLSYLRGYRPLLPRVCLHLAAM